MLTSTQVHQMTVAMFGAAAGGYTEELQAFESLKALGDFLATLDLATAKFEDATTELAQAKIIAGDFGLADNDEAVQQVVEWLLDGESLGTIYAAAIEYLTGTPAADFVEAGAAFEASVAGAEAFTAENPDVKDVDALTAGVATAEAELALTALLTTLTDANDAVSANVEAWGLAQDPAQKDLDGTDAGLVYDALFAAELAVDTAATSNGNIMGVTTTYDATNEDDADTATTFGFDTYNDDDAAEDAALGVIKVQIDAAKATLDANLVASTKALEDFSTTDVAGSLKALVDKFATQSTALEDAGDALTLLENAEIAAEAKADISLDDAFDTATKNYTFGITWNDYGDLSVAESTDADFGNYDFYYNAATNKWTYEKNGGGVYTSAEAAADADLQKLLGNADFADVLSALAAEAEGKAALDKADADLVATIRALETLDTSFTSADLTTTPETIDSADTLGGIVATYASDVADQELFAESLADFNEALADVEAARADAAALAALQSDANDALEAVSDVVTLAVIGTDDGSAEDDLFVFDGETGGAIADFGAVGADAIYFGEGYTLVEFAEGETTADALGDVATLEIFYDAANATLWVETETFGGSGVGVADLVEINLTGVTGGVELTDAGYLSATAVA